MRYWILCIMLGLLMMMGCVGCAGQEKPFSQDNRYVEEKEDASLRKTTLYYVTSEGYIVPVVRKIPWIEGVGTAALECLRDTEENRQMLSAMGLFPVLQETAMVSLAVEDGVATVSLGNLGVQNAEQEKAVVSCVVNTLLEIPGVEQVIIHANEKAAKTLLYGMDVSKPFQKIMLTNEPMAISGSKAAIHLRMYFLDPDGTCIVPIERSVLQKPDVSLAMEEYVKGPLKGWSLSNGLPTGTELLSVMINDGTVTVNFSKDFDNLAETPALEQRVMKAVAFTCRQFEGVSQVIIQVDGRMVYPHDEMEMPTFANMIT